MTAVAVATFVALASANVGRSYQYDEGVTISFFVRRDNFVDAITSQHAFNNQPLLTAVNWVIHRLGGQSEAWMRAAPIAGGAACVGLLVWWTYRRFGAAGAAAAGTLVATNPMFVELGRQARGYTFAALACLAATVLLIRCEWSLPSNSDRAGYALLLALGLLAHLYVVIAFAGHGATLLFHRRFAVWNWTRAVVLGGLLAGPVYALMLPDLLETRAVWPWRPRFAILVVEHLFAPGWVAAGGAALSAVLVVRARRSWPMAATVLASAGLLWVVVRPMALEPRFFVWVVPLLGLLAARSAPRLPVLVAVFALAAACMPETLAAARESPNLRAVARLGSEAVHAGQEVCTADFYWESYFAYAFFPQARPHRTCTVIIVRANDLDHPTVEGRALASVPAAQDVCFAARPAVLRQLGYEPGSCPVSD